MPLLGIVILLIPFAAPASSGWMGLATNLMAGILWGAVVAHFELARELALSGSPGISFLPSRIVASAAGCEGWDPGVHVGYGVGFGYTAIRCLLAGFPVRLDRNVVAITFLGWPPAPLRPLTLLAFLPLGLTTAFLAGLAGGGIAFFAKLALRRSSGMFRLGPTRRSKLGRKGGLFLWCAFGAGVTFGIVWGAVVFHLWSKEYPLTLLRGLLGAVVIIVGALIGGRVGTRFLRSSVRFR